MAKHISLAPTPDNIVCLYKKNMRCNLKTLLGIVFVCIQLLLASSGMAAENKIGVVTAHEGNVQLLRGDHVYLAKAGVEIQSNDILITGENSSVQLEMIDKSILKLGAKSRLLLADYKVRKDKSVIKATVEVLSGWLRFVVNKLKKDSDYRFNTPVMTIGVRGTEGIIEAENKTGGLFLQEGAVRVITRKGTGKSQTLEIKSGQYVSRGLNRRFVQTSKPPPGFQRRLPRAMQVKLNRRIHILGPRRVLPQKIRRLDKKDVDRLIRRHPHIQKRLQKRFRRLLPIDKRVKRRTLSVDKPARLRTPGTKYRLPRGQYPLKPVPRTPTKYPWKDRPPVKSDGRPGDNKPRDRDPTVPKNKSTSNRLNKECYPAVSRKQKSGSRVRARPKLRAPRRGTSRRGRTSSAARACK